MPAEDQKQTLYYFSVASGPGGKVMHWGPYQTDCLGQLVEKQVRFTYKSARFDAKRLAKVWRCESIFYHGRDEVMDPGDGLDKTFKTQGRQEEVEV